MSLIFLVLALLCWLVAALSDFGWLLDAKHLLGWVAFGLLFYALAALVPFGPQSTIIRRSE